MRMQGVWIKEVVMAKHALPSVQWCRGLLSHERIREIKPQREIRKQETESPGDRKAG